PWSACLSPPDEVGLGKADEEAHTWFAPHGEQKNDLAVLELIKKRSQVATAEKVYRKYPRKT
ncbi:MAG: hypothetical protein EBU36_04190, partial [Verrucomicrobia bacterium]|nr:hypothetical protein [Verrucomicrobiota bacterium]